MLQESLILIGLTLAGGVVPLFAKRSERALHLLVALATGVFLGVVFLHLLPEVSQLAAEVDGGAEHAGGADHAEHEGGHHAPSLLWLFVLVGLFGLFVLQNVVLKGHGHSHHGHADHHRHRSLGYASLIGLSVHAFTAGLGMAAVERFEHIAEPFFLSIAGHKGSEGFSLATVFLLAGFGLTRTLLGVGLFALMTPAGIALGELFVGELSANGLGMAIMTALAAGTFLYVAIGDLLPEVFHNREDVLPRLALVALGVAVSWYAHEVIG